MVLASSSKNFVRHWFVTVDKDCRHLVDPRTLQSVVSKIVDDKDLGWRSHGYKFKRIPVKTGREWRKNPGNWYDTFHIRMCSNETIRQTCNFEGLSCADMAENVIYLNVDRWLRGSDRSGLGLRDYRYYQIYHEIGHLLGRHHRKCPGKGELRPIMVQATVADDDCVPNVRVLKGE